MSFGEVVENGDFMAGVEQFLNANRPDVSRASGDQSARCNPRYRDFIDYIVLDRRSAADLVAFEESTFSTESLSDHCAISARLHVR